MKILIVTSHYPAYDIPNRKGRATPFLQQYAAEWVRNGEQVKIIHLMRRYPRLFYWGSTVLSLIGIKIFEKFSVSKAELSESTYQYEGVLVKRTVFPKYVPHSVTPAFIVRRIIKKIKQDVDDFNPDIILGDCIDPVLSVYNGIRTSDSIYLQIVHNSDLAIINKSVIVKLFAHVDEWIFRSKPQKILFLKHIGESVNCSFMYSGVEKEYLNETVQPRKRIHKLIYVGALLKSKGLGTIIEAMSLTKNHLLSLDVYGDGVDRSIFENMVSNFNLTDRIYFHGSVLHKNVFEYMRNSDALVLVSHETFGMVYVEAMSQGCIPVGVKNDGIDGVVVNGKNGFLTGLGDSRQLKELFDLFFSLNEETVARMSCEAIKTANRMSTEFLAKEAIDNFTLLIQTNRSSHDSNTKSNVNNIKVGNSQL